MEISAVRKILCKSKKACGYFYYLPNKHKIFHFFRISLQRFMENLRITHLTVIVFIVKDFMTLNGIFIIFQLAGFIQLMEYLQICHWISKQLFYRTESVFFDLIIRYGCFGVMYVSRSMELNICSSELYWYIRVLDVLEGSLKFKVLSKTFSESFK